MQCGIISPCDLKGVHFHSQPRLFEIQLPLDFPQHFFSCFAGAVQLLEAFAFNIQQVQLQLGELVEYIAGKGLASAEIVGWKIGLLQ